MGQTGGDGTQDPRLELGPIQSLEDFAGALRKLKQQQEKQKKRSISFRHLEKALRILEKNLKECGSIDPESDNALSSSSLSNYFNSKSLPKTIVLDLLAQFLEATPDQLRTLATARDQLDDASEEIRPERNSYSLASWSGPLREVPMTTFHFIGREREVEKLSGLLLESAQHVAPMMLLITGSPGVGKTTLINHVANQVKDHFPRVLHADLNGFGPNPQDRRRAYDVLGDFLVALGVPPAKLPATRNQRAAQYRSALADQHVLIVLDNAYDVEQVLPLLPGSPTCAVLVASRVSLEPLSARSAASMTVEPFTDDEANRLLNCYIGPEGAADDPEAARSLITLSAGLPLVLAVLASRAVPLRELVEGVNNRVLDALRVGDYDTVVKEVFAWSYRDLSTAAQRMFYLLGVHPGPHIGLLAAASLAGVSRDDALGLLDELVRANLVERRAGDRYACHDLLRAFAFEQARDAFEDSSDQREAAQRRALDYYLHTGHAAALQVNPRRAALSLGPPQPGTTVEDLTDEQQALAWFQREYPLLPAVSAQALDQGFHTHAWQIPWTLADYLDRQGQWQISLAVHETALIASSRLNDLEAQARTHGGLARLRLKLGPYEKSEHHAREALTCFEALQNLAGQGNANRSIAQALEYRAEQLVDNNTEKQHLYQAGLRHAERALELFQAAGSESGQAHALNQIGWYQAKLGNYRLTITNCETALGLHSKPDIEDLHGQAAACDSLGYAQHSLGNRSEAISYYDRAIILFEREEDFYKKAETLTRLGTTHLADNRPAAAREAWQEAEAIFIDLGHPSARNVRSMLDELNAQR